VKKNRHLVPELMDDPKLDPREHRQALAGLRRINFLSRTGLTLSKSILSIARRRGLDHASVLDIGCGGGEVAASVYRNLAQSIPCNMNGWDISSTAIASARNLQSSEINFETVDIFNVSTDLARFDFVYCSLFLHHFSHDQSIALLKIMRSLASQAVIIDDLLRSTLGLWLAHVGCRLLSRSAIVHFDGPQSVRAAYTRDEISDIARSSGLVPFTLYRHWPERFMFLWETP
jgi:2-polyprenyl-3-methyl-5-hydroxy-6-metoxy-1,4-benzoquinol methylase